MLFKQQPLKFNLILICFFLHIFNYILGYVHVMVIICSDYIRLEGEIYLQSSE